MKNLHLKAGQRDMLLQQLANEDLVRIEGKCVVGTTYPEFVDALYQRPEFPQVECRWPEVRGEAKLG